MTTKNKSTTPRTEPSLRKWNGTPFSLGAITPAAGTQKSVLLSDWWVTKKENGLGIEGFEWKDGSVVRRLFSSATISNRLDTTTLETEDGITVCISGVINKSITLDNGFSLGVCNAFLLGFPYNWKDFNEEEKKHFGISFDDIPVSRLQDLLLTPSSCFRDDILDDVVGSLRDLVACPRMSDDESSVPVVVGVKTRGMLKRGQDAQASIGQRVHTASKKRNTKT